MFIILGSLQAPVQSDFDKAHLSPDTNEITILVHISNDLQFLFPHLSL